ncbi:hypothetical protein PR202_gn00296 [Eleusine coracana subsp. coracana]|uniref:Jacalin-type lectin domain-containing protein n=1 Tax=Eleusine coracana subsp. coracana TaxID=191504 RepID=A0AAV5G163_ELECO|nr:hypothetical protein PR202_gn00191 [Eleusine coracana subsp. coracana]GJN40979.1 hypothetical protein PR202_gn00296 [Eleusine coracana subsp. coracana]
MAAALPASLSGGEAGAEEDKEKERLEAEAQLLSEAALRGKKRRIEKMLKAGVAYRLHDGGKKLRAAIEAICRELARRKILGEAPHPQPHGGGPEALMQTSVVKIGLFGSASGDNCDITVAPLRLETITIHSGDVVDALAFTYRDRDKLVHTAGPWGGSGGGEHTIQLGPSEFVTEVHGMHGPYTHGPHGRPNCITNLTFITNLRSYGPFGVGDLATENRFSVPTKNNSSIVGFFAHADKYYLNGVGVYVKPF